MYKICFQNYATHSEKEALADEILELTKIDSSEKIFRKCMSSKDSKKTTYTILIQTSNNNLKSFLLLFLICRFEQSSTTNIGFDFSYSDTRR